MMRNTVVKLNGKQGEKRDIGMEDVEDGGDGGGGQVAGWSQLQGEKQIADEE